MKKLLILSLSLITFFGYSQTLVDPTLTPTTARINAAIADAVSASGTDTYTGTKSGLTNVSGRAYSVTFTNANTGSATFNLNAGGAVTIRKFEIGSLVNLVAGDISAGETKRLRYNGTYLVIEGGSGSGGGGGSVNSVTGTANQIASTGGTDPVLSIVTNVILPGSPTIASPGNSTQNIVTTDATQTLSNKTLVAPALGTPASGVATNLTGTAAGLTAGNVTTNANLTGDVTSIGNATSIASGVIVDADVNASAAIAGTKIANTPAGNIAATTSQAAINELDAEKENLLVTYNNQVASYTLALSDYTNNTEVRISNASPNNLTVPDNATVAFPVGTRIQYRQTGAGLTTFVQGGSTVITSTSGLLVSPGQNFLCLLEKTGTNTWALDNGAPPLSSGDVTTALGFTPMPTTLSSATTITGTSSNTLRFLFNSLGTTATTGAGALFENTTAAAAGSQQISPLVSFRSNGWKTTSTAASQATEWNLYNLPVQGTTNPTSQFIISSKVNNVATNGGLTLSTDGAFMQTFPNGLKILNNNTTVSGGLSLTSTTPVFNTLSVDKEFAITVVNGSNTGVGATMLGLNINGNAVYASGTGVGLGVTTNFAPISGNAAWNAVGISNIINQTGGSNGTVSGFKLSNTYTSAGGNVADFWVNNTNTSIAGTHYGIIGFEGSTLSGVNTVTPVSRFEVNGSFGANITTVTSNTNLDATHYTVLCDATSGNITITLPTASGVTKRIYIIKKIDSSGNTVSFTTADGSIVLSAQWTGRQIQSNGTSYYVTGSF